MNYIEKLKQIKKNYEEKQKITERKIKRSKYRLNFYIGNLRLMTEDELKYAEDGIFIELEDFETEMNQELKKLELDSKLDESVLNYINSLLSFGDNVTEHFMQEEFNFAESEYQKYARIVEENRKKKLDIILNTELFDTELLEHLRLFSLIDDVKMKYQITYAKYHMLKYSFFEEK